MGDGEYAMQAGFHTSDGLFFAKVPGGVRVRKWRPNTLCNLSPPCQANRDGGQCWHDPFLVFEQVLDPETWASVLLYLEAPA